MKFHLKYNFFIYIICSVSLSCCGQEKKSAITSDGEKISIIQNPDINSQNFVAKLTEKVKHYPKEPIYYMRLAKANCVIEVLVNDYLVHEDYELSNYATPIRINHGILKSGKQKLTYRVYPTGDLMKESYGGDEATVTTLTDLTSVSIKIIQMDNKGEQKLKDEVVVMQHNSLTDKNDKFIASGKPFYEYTFEFQAEVPYELEGWTKGQDLTKLDQKLLETKALEFHTMYQKIYENEDADALAKSDFGSELLDSQMYYRNSKNLFEVWEHYNNGLKIKNKKFNELNDYKMKFYAEGRILVLMQRTLEFPYRGKSGLTFDYIDEDGDEAFYSCMCYLYLPKEKKLEDGLQMRE